MKKKITQQQQHEGERENTQRQICEGDEEQNYKNKIYIFILVTVQLSKLILTWSHKITIQATQSVHWCCCLSTIYLIWDLINYDEGADRL